MDGHRTPVRDRPMPVPDSYHAIVIRCEPPGVVLVVRGSLEASACELLREVVRAALVAVRRATRIHLDLSSVSPVPKRLPRIVRALERAGATVTTPRAETSEPAAGVVRRPRILGAVT
jgi:hypothetical protein